MQIGTLVRLKSQWTASTDPIVGVVVAFGEGTLFSSAMAQVQWAFNDDLVWMDITKMEVLCR